MLYTYHENSSPVNGGTINVAPEPNCTGGKYLWGTEVTLNTTRSEQHLHAAGAATHTALPTALTVTMYSDVSLSPANFESLYKQGEVSCDNQIDVVDAMFILQYDIGLRSATTQCPIGEDTLLVKSCDVNQDNACNSAMRSFLYPNATVGV